MTGAGDPGEDAGHAGGIISPCYPRNASEMLREEMVVEKRR